MKRPRARRSGRYGLVLVFLGLFGAGAGLGQLSGMPVRPGLGLAHARPTGTAAHAMARSTPTRIAIPSIGVSAPIDPVGLAADGSIDTPPLRENNLAGWYRGGPAPGEMGPAIVVGHVDGPGGGSVFYQLGRLKPGDRVQISLADRRIALFSVYSVEVYSKNSFPGDRVYNDFSRPGLRLITCGGKWVGGALGYADNIVVYAALQLRG